jgi:hypothetical protein
VATHVYDDALFRAQFPAFANTTTYPEALLAGYFAMATCYLDPDDGCKISGGCLQLALNLLTAHLAYLNSSDPGGNVGVITSASIDKISTTVTIPVSNSAFSVWLNLSGYGLQLRALLKTHAVGGDYVGGSIERRAFRKAGGVW